MFAGPAIPLSHTNTDDSEFLTGEPISEPELIRQSDYANAMIGSDSNNLPLTWFNSWESVNADLCISETDLGVHSDCVLPL